MAGRSLTDQIGAAAVLSVNSVQREVQQQRRATARLHDRRTPLASCDGCEAILAERDAHRQALLAGQVHDHLCGLNRIASLGVVGLFGPLAGRARGGGCSILVVQLEPPIGIEPMTYALRACSRALVVAPMPAPASHS
jgi:hypothetical protein